MGSGSVRKGLQEKITDMMKTAVGPASSATDKIVTFDNRLRDVPITSLPFLAIIVREKDQDGAGEIGTMHELWKWRIHMYYLDIVDDYDAGEDRRDKIVDDIETVIEQSPRLENLSVTLNPQGNTESVWDSNFTNVIFDMSGQDDFYTFVCELYFDVDTQRN